MRSSGNSMRRVLNWAAESPQNLIRAALLLLGIWVLGFILVFGLPKWAVSSALEKSQADIDLVASLYHNTEERLSLERTWYMTGYTKDLPEYLSQASSQIESARRSLEDANGAWNPDTKIDLASDSRKYAENANSLLGKVTTRLNEISEVRDKAYSKLTEIRTLEEEARSGFLKLQARFTVEEAKYLTKYTSPLDETLASINKKLEQADAYIFTAADLLPVNTDKAGKGNPQTAIGEIDAAKALIDEINSLMAQVTGQLDYLAEAERSAQTTTTQAESEYQRASQYVSSLKVQTGYWLNQASSSIAFSEKNFEVATTTLKTQVEGKIDYPVSYEAAKSSIESSKRAVAEADGEVALAQLVFSTIASVEAEIGSAEGDISRARTSESTLQNYHAGGAWSSVATNTVNAANMIQTSRQNKADAERLASLDLQKFQEAKEEADNALSQVKDARSSAQLVIDTESSLEGYRGEWPSTESRAQSAINNETPQIVSYGSYDSFAQSDYNRAVSLLSEARNHASSWYYQPAVEKANEAESTVRGAGSRAESAYDDYQAEQERQRQEAERAAQEAAQRAIDEALSSSGSSDSGGGIDLGGSSSGGSDFGGSDFGGGGSDSDFGGGGSDSDW